MALKKTSKPAVEPSEIQLVRHHPTNPILITPEDILEGPTRIQIRTPRPLVIRCQSSNRLDLGAVIMLPENTTAKVEAIASDAHQRGYSVTSDTLKSGDEVCLFFRNPGMRTVLFAEGEVVGILMFQRHRAMTVEVDCALPEAPVKLVQSRAGKVPEGDLPFET